MRYIRESAKHTGDIEMHAQTRGAERVSFSFKPPTGIHDVFSTILCTEEFKVVRKDNVGLTVLSFTSTSL